MCRAGQSAAHLLGIASSCTAGAASWPWLRARAASEASGAQPAAWPQGPPAPTLRALPALPSMGSRPPNPLCQQPASCAAELGLCWSGFA
eukprot:scaffold54175_cov41-Prasinocladus_malaysianus.AAC.1